MSHVHHPMKSTADTMSHDQKSMKSTTDTMSHDQQPMKSTADTMSHDQQPMKSSADVLPVNPPASPQAEQTGSDLSLKLFDIDHTLTPHTLIPHTPLSKLRGIVIALCCHHRCRWQQMVGREWLSGCGFSAVDFHLISHMSSWAVCGVRSVGGEGGRGEGRVSGEEEVCSHKEEEEEGERNSTTQGKIQLSLMQQDTSNPIDTTATGNHGDTMATYRPSKTMATCNPDNTPANCISTMATSNQGDTTTCKHGNTTATCNRDNTTATYNYGDATTCNHGNAMTTSPSLPPSYSPHPREGVGMVCKRVLDLARLHWLWERGWGGRLVTFVPRATSLENVLLIATPPQPVM